jgi:hypothetical protein
MSTVVAKTISVDRIRAAYAVAICTDLIQIGFSSLFGEGFLSPLDDALDAVACLALTALVGWHNAFIPTFLIEILPVGDLAPTWTVAIFIVTRGRHSSPQQTPPARAVPCDEKGRLPGMAKAGPETALTDKLSVDDQYSTTRCKGRSDNRQN